MPPGTADILVRYYVLREIPKCHHLHGFVPEYLRRLIEMDMDTRGTCGDAASSIYAVTKSVARVRRGLRDICVPSVLFDQVVKSMVDVKQHHLRGLADT